MERCDVLVIGGGPAGASAAILLARAGRRVVVLEKAAFPRRKVCGEFIAPAGIQRLRELGLGEAVDAAAGPEIRRIAVWTGGASFEAPMPRYRWKGATYPRALEREALDALLLEQARHCGALVLQPAQPLHLERSGRRFVCLAARRRGGAPVEIEAGTLIAAHGSWEAGALPTQPPHLSPAPEDLLAFQAHFRGGGLPPQTIVLQPFAGGYAGLVERRGGGVTFACCLRRDALARLRARGTPAGESVFRFLQGPALRTEREGPWLAAGPLRPGKRRLYRDGVFAIGNAAGEAHPVVGEGITLALHSAALLCRPLNAALESGFPAGAEKAVARAYAWRWRRHIAWRLALSARLAGLAMQPSSLGAKLLGFMPTMLTLAARLK